MHLVNSLAVLALATLPFAFSQGATPSSKYAHGITDDVAGPELKPRMPVGPPHHFWARQASNATVTITSSSSVTSKHEQPSTTYVVSTPPPGKSAIVETTPATTTEGNKHASASTTKFTMTYTDGNGNVKTLTSTSVFIPHGTATKTVGQPELATGAATPLGSGNGLGAIVAAGAMAVGALVL